MTDEMETYRQVFELAAEAQLILQDGAIIANNPAAAEVFRTDGRALVGRTLLDFASPSWPYGDEPRKVLEEHLAQAEAARQRFDTFLLRLDDAFFRATVTISRLSEKKLLVSIHDLSPHGPNTSWFDRFFHLSPDLLGLADTQGRFVRLNGSWQKVLGYTDEELLTCAYLDFVHPEDREKTLAEAARLAAGGEGQYFENRYRHKDGTYRWIEWTSVAFPDDGLIAFTARDITHDRENERALLDAKGRLRSLVESIPAVVMMADREGRVQSINHPPSGRRSEDVVGADSFQYVQPEYTDIYREAFMSVLATGKATRIETKGTNPPANYRVDMGPVWREGEVVGVTTISMNVTEQRRMEQELRESKERLRSIMESAPVMIIAVDREARITSINRAFTNRPLDDFVGLSFYDYLQPEQKEVFDKHFKSVLETGSVMTYDEHVVVPRVNVDKWLRNQMGPLRKDGEIVGATCIVTDITEQQKLEEEVRASHERIRAYAEEMEIKNTLLEEEIAERAQSEEARRAQQEMIRAMATPIIRVWQGVLALPVIGLVDASRAAQMMDLLLQNILESRARFAIMDLTGVERVDAETAMHLSNIVGAARLLGSQVVLSGISPQIAQTMVQHHLATESYRSFGKLEDALRYALSELGVRFRAGRT